MPKLRYKVSHTGGKFGFWWVMDGLYCLCRCENGVDAAKISTALNYHHEHIKANIKDEAEAPTHLRKIYD